MTIALRELTQLSDAFVKRYGLHPGAAAVYRYDGRTHPHVLPQHRASVSEALAGKVAALYGEPPASSSVEYSALGEPLMTVRVNRVLPPVIMIAPHVHYRILQAPEVSANGKEDVIELTPNGFESHFCRPERLVSGSARATTQEAKPKA